MNIKCLSLHITNECNFNCPFCYIKKTKYSINTLKDYSQFVEVCKKFNIRQIALGGGEPFIYQGYSSSLAKLCKDNDIIINATTNGSYPNPIGLKYFNLVSISIDSYKLQKMSLDTHINNARFMRRITKVGFNLLLDKYIQDNLYSILKRIEPYSDYIYLLQMKHYKGPKLDRKKILTSVVLFSDKILVDESIKLSLGLSDRCGRGREIVSIHPDKSVRACSFSKPLGYFYKLEDIITIIKNNYPMKETRKCPYLIEK